MTIMLDTIHLKINDLKKHRTLYDLILMNNKTTFGRFNLKDSEPLAKPTISRWLDRDIIFMQSTGRAIEKFSYHSHHVASSHYTIAISVDPSNDCITFNFSIPKYFFGTNIFQAVDHYTDRDYTSGSPFDTWEYKANDYYSRFRSYIKAFFAKEFGGATIDYTQVQLMRLDLCFNLIFDTKDSALSYLVGQKQITKKYQRDATDVLNNYQTSFFYRNADYSFKVYHKGTEYNKNDRKKHQKTNENTTGSDNSDFGKTKKTKELIPVLDYQELADRTLRFEMSFFSSYISKVFNQNIRKQKDSMGNFENKGFKNLKHIYEKITSLLQKDVYFDINGLPLKFNYQIDHYDYIVPILDLLKSRNVPILGISYYSYILERFGKVYKKITKHNELQAFQNFHNAFNNYLSKSHKIFLQMEKNELNRYTDCYNNGISLEHFHKIKFDTKLFDIIQNKFWKTVKEFELVDLPDSETFKKSMSLFNSSQKSKKGGQGVDEAKMILIYELIKRGFKLNTLKTMLSLSKSTYYRYVAFFSYCGIKQGSVSHFYKPFFDFSSYYNEINQEKYRKILASSFSF